jgi:hypothetical protein
MAGRYTTKVVPTEEYRLKAEADPPPQPVDDDEEVSALACWLLKVDALNL